jgi:hypothetical protein
VDLKQLEHFVALADERHFTRASRRLNLVQSGLSASIRSLKEDLGGPLFIRSTRRVDLSPAGEVLFDEARGCPLTKARRGPLVQAVPQASTSNSVQEYRIFPWLCPARRRETQPTAILSDRFASFQSSAWRSCSRHV